MKVNIEFESTDAEGNVTVSKVFAVMEARKYDYRLVYVEDLSGEGNMTKSTMLVSQDSLRITRTGELVTDFIYGRALVHNTTYGTQYGNLPITIETETYECSLYQGGGALLQTVSWDAPTLPEDFELHIHTAYRLLIDSREPMPMQMKIRITGA